MPSDIDKKIAKTILVKNDDMLLKIELLQPSNIAYNRMENNDPADTDNNIMVPGTTVENAMNEIANNMANNMTNNTAENDAHDNFVNQTMLTCIGNKRKLIPNIRSIIDDVRKMTGKDKLNIVDGFCGSSVVSRELSYVADHIYCNDLELYSYIMSYCYLVKPTNEDQEKIIRHIQNMNEIAANGPYNEGIICRLYAPQDTKNIKAGERCFYTRENALIIDSLRKYIAENVEKTITNYCLAPLLNKASINVNTAGVFKGFYKKDDIGCFGGKGENALCRILKPIRLDVPVWSCCEYTAHPSNKDINILVDELPDDIDVMYLDPPYNQHPYGSNYFMLNVIAKNEEPIELSVVSGIPKNWNKSSYNNKSAKLCMKKLLAGGMSKSNYIVISYNNEGIITSDEWKTLFELYDVKTYNFMYDTYKGSRNLKDRSDKVTEIMYLVSKKQ